jgi:hypothetical protein
MDASTHQDIVLACWAAANEGNMTVTATLRWTAARRCGTVKQQPQDGAPWSLVMSLAELARSVLCIKADVYF